MPSFRRSLLVLIVLATAPFWPALVGNGRAQAPPAGVAPAAAGCGSSVTPEEAARMREQLARGEIGRVPVNPAPPPYCVPIAGHIVRRSDGTGGMSLSQYFQSIDDANTYFAGTGIQFYSLGIDYIDDDFFYSGIQTQADIDALRSTNVVADAINVYYTPTLPGLCGISSFTFSSVQGIVMNNACSGVPWDPSTMPHEIGHYFNLYHTHETAFGAEFVDGSNCNTAGDLLCDTPADPNLSGVVTSAPSCTYVGTATDGHGDPYSPDPHQIMSYATALCRDTFSPQSQTKAVNTLLTSRSNLLSRGCNPVGSATITAVTPAYGFADQTRDVTITGTNLGTFTTVDFGADVTVNSTTAISSTELVVNVTIPVTAALGPRNVIVDNAFAPDTLVGGFEVRDTPVHYVSATGAALYPYGSPADAANRIEDALAAASAGDTVKVDSAAVGAMTLIVDRPVTLSGGWVSGFTARPTGVRTRVTLVGNVQLSGPGGTLRLEHFVIENGQGSLGLSPATGKWGGGVQLINTTGEIRDCEIRNNTSNTSPDYGGGGGVFVLSSTFTIADCSIHDNTGTVGGGVYAFKSTGTISQTVFAGNVANNPGINQPEGAHLAIDSSTVTVSACTFTGGSGARDGGAVWSRGSTVTLDACSVTGTSASFDGGGVFVRGGAMTVTATTFSGCKSNLFGGAIGSEDTGTGLALDGVSIDSCSAVIGGGVYASGAALDVAHLLVRRCSASSGGGGLYLSSCTGTARNMTLHADSAGTGAGGITLVSGSARVFNTIVSGSIGHGISCTSPGSTVDHTLVFGSTGSDFDACTSDPSWIVADPLFADAGGGDYHLLLDSPAIDAGDPDPLLGLTDPDGGRADLGYYGAGTAPMDRPARPTGLTASLVSGASVLSWSRNAEPDVAYYAVYCDTVAGFTPSAANRVATTPDTTWSLGVLTDTLYCVVSAVDTSGYAGGYSDPVTSAPATATPVLPAKPLRTALEPAVPNPFNPTTTIGFSLAERAHVRLVVFDVSGRRVRTLVDATRAPAHYRVTWDGRTDRGARVASGVYFYRLEAGAFRSTRKMVLLK